VSIANSKSLAFVDSMISVSTVSTHIEEGVVLGDGEYIIEKDKELFP